MKRRSLSKTPLSSVWSIAEFSGNTFYEYRISRKFHPWKRREMKMKCVGSKSVSISFYSPLSRSRPPPSLLSIRPSIFLPSQKRQKFPQTSVAFRFLDSPQLSNTCPIISPSVPRTPPICFPLPPPTMLFLPHLDSPIWTLPPSSFFSPSPFPSA